MEKMIFVKAAVSDYCAIVTMRKGQNIFVDEVIMCTDINDLLDYATKLVGTHYPECVYYDASIFRQELWQLRELIPDTHVNGYRPSLKHEERVAAQALWIKKNLSINKEYQNFIDLLASYNGKEYNIAADILSDAARYYREQMMYD